jgi:hypothetical protein
MDPSAVSNVLAVFSKFPRIPQNQILAEGNGLLVKKKQSIFP